MTSNPDLIIEKVSLLIISGNKSFCPALMPYLSSLFVFIFFVHLVWILRTEKFASLKQSRIQWLRVKNKPNWPKNNELQIKVYKQIIFHQENFSLFCAALRKVCNNLTNNFLKKNQKTHPTYTDPTFQNMLKDKKFKISKLKELSSTGKNHCGVHW